MISLWVCQGIRWIISPRTLGFVPKQAPLNSPPVFHFKGNLGSVSVPWPAFSTLPPLHRGFLHCTEQHIEHIHYMARRAQEFNNILLETLTQFRNGGTSTDSLLASLPPLQIFWNSKFCFRLHWVDSKNTYTLFPYSVGFGRIPTGGLCTDCRIENPWGLLPIKNSFCDIFCEKFTCNLSAEIFPVVPWESFRKYQQRKLDGFAKSNRSGFGTVAC